MLTFSCALLQQLHLSIAKLSHHSRRCRCSKTWQERKYLLQLALRSSLSSWMH